MSNYRMLLILLFGSLLFLVGFKMDDLIISLNTENKINALKKLTDNIIETNTAFFYYGDEYPIKDLTMLQVNSITEAYSEDRRAFLFINHRSSVVAIEELIYDIRTLLNNHETEIIIVGDANLKNTIYEKLTGKLNDRSEDTLAIHIAQVNGIAVASRIYFSRDNFGRNITDTKDYNNILHILKYLKQILNQ